jgi:sugar lactone lactonase YvrE
MFTIRCPEMWRALNALACAFLIALLPVPAAKSDGQTEPEKSAIITTIAGTGEMGFSGDGGKATQARLNMPFHCDLDKAGNLYIVDTENNRIRKVDVKTGLIATVAGNGQKASGDTRVVGEGDGGPAIMSAVSIPYAVAVDANSDLYIVEQKTTLVRKVDAATGIISTVAGTGKPGFSGDGGPGNAAQLWEPNDCCLDGKGGLLIADVQDWRIRRLDLKTGIIATFAGTGRPKDTGLAFKQAVKSARTKLGDGGKATAAVIVGARAVCVDGNGNTYVCEREGNAIRKVDAQGVISTLAGTGEAGYGGDGGDATRATFKNPKGVRCDAKGNVYVVDSDNNAIRKIDVTTKRVTTVAGGRKGGQGDGGNAADAGLDWPHGCVIGPDGSLYIADSRNQRVRRVGGP